MSIDPGFLEAIKKGDVRKVERMLEGDPSLVKETGQDGLSPVLVAAYHRKPDVADVIASYKGLLDIFEAAALGKTVHIIRILSREHGLVNAFSVDGFQPLGLASFFGHYETADYLIGAGASINTPSSNPLKVTPLHSAAAGGHLKIVELLLKCGADPNLRQNGGFTPLHAAAQNGQVDMVRMLLFHGADRKVRSDDGKNAIDMANESGHTDVVGLLKSESTRRFPKK